MVHYNSPPDFDAHIMFPNSHRCLCSSNCIPSAYIWSDNTFLSESTLFWHTFPSPTLCCLIMPLKHACKSPHAGIPSAPVGSPQQFFVIDSTIPCHFINDQSLFTTFTPVSKVFCSSFGTDVAFEGHGTVPLYFMAFGQLHAFSTTCAYTPSIPY